VLNYVPFLGQATMLGLIFLVGLGTRDGITSALLPVGCYWALSFLESQVVTPNLLGRTMTINPFLIFLSLAYWLWAWGPVGGLIAVPSLLVLHSVITHIIPTRSVVSARIRHKLDSKASADATEAAPTKAVPAEPVPQPKQAAADTKAAGTTQKPATPKRARKPAATASS